MNGDKEKINLTRRKLLLAGGALSTFGLAACGGGHSKPPVTPAPDGPPPVVTPIIPVPVIPTPPPVSTPNFYGVNIHPFYVRDLGKLKRQLNGINANAVRVDVYDDQSLASVETLAQFLTPQGIKVMPVITAGMQKVADEKINYDAAYAFADKVAQRLSQWCDTFECGNELDRNSNVYAGFQGDQIGPFKNSGWDAYRGTLRGLIDGVKGVRAGTDPLRKDLKTSVDFCVCDINAAQMLWDGTRPDPDHGLVPNSNAAPGPVTRWDITAWHWYRIYGDLENCTNPYNPSDKHMNLIQEMNQRFALPIMFTEWGQKPEDTLTQAGADQVTTMLQTFFNYRALGVKAAFNYELAKDDENFGLYMPDGATLTKAGQAYRDFAAAHPV
jgi:hypothetical protein